MLSTSGVSASCWMLTLFSGSTMDVPSTVTSVLAFRPPLIHPAYPLLELPWITPGTRFASAKGLRPFSGRSKTFLLSTVVDTVEVVVASWVAEELTSTVVLSSPILRTTSSSALFWTSTVTPLVEYFWKPTFSTVTLYVLGCRYGCRKFPSELLVVTWRTAVRSFSMVTFASGTAAPESSATRPCRMPVAVCPKAVELNIRIVAIGTIRNLDMGSLLAIRPSTTLLKQAGLWTAAAKRAFQEYIRFFRDCKRHRERGVRRSV